MPAIDMVMKRLGFVKLSRYGLVLTPEGRVMTMRPAVLDDGFGNRIVGWQEGDLAAAELEKWEPARPASKPAVALPVASAPPPPRRTSAAPVAIAPERVAAVASTPVVAVPSPAPIVPAAPVVTRGANVEPEPPEEDDWEWTIAIARSRAAAEEAELAAAAARAPAPRRRAETVPPPVSSPKFVPAKTMPMAKVAAKPVLETQASRAIEPLPDWSKTEELDYNDYSHPAKEVARVALPRQAKGTPAPVIAAKAVAPVIARAASPATVIPIPRLPTVANPQATFAPVVRALPTPIMPAPRRLAKGTGPVLPTVPSVRPISEDTVPGAMAFSDDTVPGLTLPAVARTVALPSIKRLSRG